MLLRIFTEPQQGATYDDLLAIARKTEECGFDAFFRSDHYLAMEGADGLPGPTDSWITLAGLARETSRIKLGTLVSSATFRHPDVLAVSVAQVDQMSGGRVELGLGAGWFEPEHQAYGLDFPDTPRRFDLLAEQLELITGRPHPPIIVGGAGRRRTPALAARYASEFNAAFKNPEETKILFDRVQEACRTIGRDPETLALSTAQWTVVGKDDAQVKARAAAVNRDPYLVVPTASLVGTPAQVVDRMGEYAAAGCTRQYLQIMDLGDLDHLELIASEVLPHFA